MLQPVIIIFVFIQNYDVNIMNEIVQKRQKQQRQKQQLKQMLQQQRQQQQKILISYRKNLKNYYNNSPNTNII